MSSLGFNQIALLVKKFEKRGWDPERVTQFGQATTEQYREIEAILDGWVTVQVCGIDRTQSDAEAVKATDRDLDERGDIDYAKYLPVSDGDSEKITFIPLKESMFPDEVDALVEKVGTYASFKGLCKFNQDNPEFAKKTPHFIQGKNEENSHYYSLFIDQSNHKLVYVRDYSGNWSYNFYVAVVLAGPEDPDA